MIGKQSKIVILLIFIWLAISLVTLYGETNRAFVLPEVTVVGIGETDLALPKLNFSLSVEKTSFEYIELGKFYSLALLRTFPEEDDINLSVQKLPAWELYNHRGISPLVKPKSDNSDRLIWGGGIGYFNNLSTELNLIYVNTSNFLTSYSFELIDIVTNKMAGNYTETEVGIVRSGSNIDYSLKIFPIVFGTSKDLFYLLGGENYLHIGNECYSVSEYAISYFSLEPEGKFFTFLRGEIDAPGMFLQPKFGMFYGEIGGYSGNLYSRTWGLRTLVGIWRLSTGISFVLQNENKLSVYPELFLDNSFNRYIRYGVSTGFFNIVNRKDIRRGILDEESLPSMDSCVRYKMSGWISARGFSYGLPFVLRISGDLLLPVDVYDIESYNAERSFLYYAGVELENGFLKWPIDIIVGSNYRNSSLFDMGSYDYLDYTGGNGAVFSLYLKMRVKLLFNYTITCSARGELHGNVSVGGVSIYLNYR